MVKQMLYTIVVVAFGSLMASSAAAQNTLPPATPPPHYCNPCLFYGGDTDPAIDKTGDWVK